MKNELGQDKRREACPAVAYQDISVSVPVTVRPITRAGAVKTKCLGTTVVSARHESYPGGKCGVCKFIITQKMQVEVPLLFEAEAEIDDPAVDCGCPKVEDGCGKDRPDCDK